jgi:hypothetical protein
VNWSRGLLRLWIAFTICWVGACAFLTYEAFPVAEETGLLSETPPGEGRYTVLAPPNMFADLIPDPLVEKRRVFRKETLPMALALAIGVPAGFFAAGWTLLWIGRGFRS